MTSAPTPVAYPFNGFTDLELADEYVRAQARPGLTRIRLPFGEPAWLATRYDDVRLVLSDKRFSRAEATRRENVPRAFARIAGGIVMMDAPELTRIRKLAMQAFTHRRVEQLRPHVRELSHRLIDQMIEKHALTGAPADLVADYALPIPISVICELLGVPVQDQERFRVWNDSLLSTDASAAEQTQRHLGELAQYILQLIAARRSQPRDDLMTALLEAHDQGDRLNEPEMVSLCIAILVAGYEGTSSQIPNFAHTLLARPQAWERLQREPERLDAAIEELLRFVPLASAAMFVHYASEDIQVGETLVRKGEPVFASIGAANRDPERFPLPEELDFDRDARAHYAFGCGMHACVGASLARVELQESLRALVERLPGLRLAGPVGWKTQSFFRGMLLMPVLW